ncbi:MAG: DNA primase [Chloroflexota bacterium]
MPGLEGVVEQVKERLDIASLVGAQVVLKKSGRSLKGLCPFHSEKTPSFYVFPDKGNYHCFGCGANGDAFTWVMRTQNLGFGEALRLLAEQSGVELPERQAAPTEDRALERLREICAAAAQFYQHQLRTEAGRAARAYLDKRGIDQATIDAFQLGAAPEGWDHLLRFLAERAYGPDEVALAGLATARDGGHGHYDRFRNRLLFPIWDVKGRITGFGARALDDSLPKYLNSSQTPLFDKGGCLYGIDKAIPGIREQGSAVIVEGYFDVVVLHQHGITNVVASLGTALTERQVGLLKRHTKKVLLALDADAAGAEATRRGLEVAIQVFDRKTTPVPTGRGRVRYEETVDADIRILQLPEGRDPDEVVKEDPSRWHALVAAAQPVLDFYFALTSAKLDLSQPQAKSRAVAELLPVVRELAGDKVRQWHYVQRLANMVRVDERLLLTRLEQLGRVPAGRVEPSTPRPTRRPALAREEYYLGLLLVNLEQAPLEGLLSPDEADVPQVRQVLEAIWVAWQEGPLGLSRFLASLDPVLQEYCAALVERMATRPQVPAEGLADELNVAALRVREQNCVHIINDLHHSIREAQEVKDEDQVMVLSRREHEVNERLGETHRKLGELQTLRRR